MVSTAAFLDMHEESPKMVPDSNVEVDPKVQLPQAQEKESRDESSLSIATPDTNPSAKGEAFQPIDLTTTRPTPDPGLPPEIWTIVQSAPANFAPSFFLEVSRNLLENPNLTASHLSRAELSYASFTDATYDPSATHPHALASIIKHLKKECQPLLVEGGVPGYELTWTVVRKLIPRNPKLDQTMMQTCHLYTSTHPITITEKNGIIKQLDAERYLVVYLPHISSPDDMPYYHPKVRALAILYTYHPSVPITSNLSIYFSLFPTYPLDNRLSRTALKMLEIIHKHARGRAAGYQKRVHHDVVIPQKTFQDTYAYLKGKYSKNLIDGWVEQTPPEKHVFEDLGIAAFLIELWVDMYGGETSQSDSTREKQDGSSDERAAERRLRAQTEFPGFVDMGCGNGLLVWILNQEGWRGWGFDARRRKTWAVLYPDSEQDKLKEMLLVPAVLQPTTTSPSPDDSTNPPSHPGIFPPSTFLISNHADELTAWTPLLAYLSSSPFIAIPCCSHNLGGTRFRAPSHIKHMSHAERPAQGKMASAYASLCSYVAFLTEEMGFVVEKEYLRIPSTRNVTVVGRRMVDGKEGKDDGEGEEGVMNREKGEESVDEKMEFVRKIVEKEMVDCSIEQVRLLWLKRGSGLVKEKGGH
jgi:tRNASer (uridine44-2'-O)-methyltransferase